MTTDLHLRDVTDDDLPIFFDHQLDPVANEMGAFSPRDRDAFTAHWTRVLGDDTVIKKTIVVDGQVAGNVVSFLNAAGEREVGYWIGRGYWGRGVATGALSAFLDDIEARPLHARVAKRNVASLRVLERCGFTITGQDKEAFAPGGEVVEGFLLELRE